MSFLVRELNFFFVETVWLLLLESCVFSWESWVFSFAWDGLGFSLERGVFSRATVEIIPFLETVEFFFMEVVFSFVCNESWFFVFVTGGVAFFFFFLAIVFLRLESLNCFSSERVLILQLRDFQFFFSERDELFLCESCVLIVSWRAFFATLRVTRLTLQNSKTLVSRPTVRASRASRACCGPLN